MSDNILEAIDRTRAAIEENYNRPWIIAFSGGKDSTATLKVFISAYRKAKLRPQRVEVIYCDTGVENPIIDAYVKKLMSQMQSEFQSLGLPIEVCTLKAPVEERFFVKVIGRGYPTPTNSFRWCTKSLRISPVSRFIQSRADKEAIVLLGVRKSESAQRSRSVNKHGGEHWQKQAESKFRYDLFLPILDMSLSDVWDTVFFLDFPRSISPHQIEKIYSDASGECPVIKSPDSPPCTSGRFGCWTCTVVRKDRSAIKMIDAGHVELEPYLELRNWLSEFRNDQSMRWPQRRNGVQRPGPFSIKGRKEILGRVRSLEKAVNQVIIDDDEAREIQKLWELDFDQERELGLG